MRKRSIVLVVLAVFVGTIFGDVALARKFNAGSQAVPCGDGTITAVEKIKNRNHKLRGVTLVYDETTNDGDTIGISVDAVTHEEEGFEKGSTRKHEPDFVLPLAPGTALDTADSAGASTRPELRGERLTKPKDGRTYDLTVTCTDDDASNPVVPAPTSDTVHVFIKVPHSSR